MDVSELFPIGLTASQVVFALLAVVVGWIASRLAGSAIKKLAHRTPGVTPSVAQLVARFTQYLILLAGIGVALVFLGADVQPILAMTIIAVVVLVLVLRGVADNFAAGVLIQSRQSVRVGEQIAVEGPDGEMLTGVVHDLNGRAAILLTTDGRTVHVPHSILMSGLLINESRHGGRRGDVHVRVERSASLELDDVMARVVQAVRDADGVHTHESPTAVLTGVSADRWMLTVQFWHDPLHGPRTTAHAVRRIADVLTAAGVGNVVSSDPVASPLVPPDAL